MPTYQTFISNTSYSNNYASALISEYVWTKQYLKKPQSKKPQKQEPPKENGQFLFEFMR